MNSKFPARRQLLWGLLITITVLLIVLPLGKWLLRIQTAPPEPEAAYVSSPSLSQSSFGPMPDFSLIDPHGREVSHNDLDGRIWIADFIFTSCAGTCPIMTQNMSRLQDRLSKDIRLVSFSVDPVNDSPVVLGEFSADYQADQTRWFFLTGEPGATQTLANKISLAVEDGGDPNEPIIHSQRFILIDRKGQIRGYFDGTDDEAVEHLINVVRKLQTQE